MVKPSRFEDFEVGNEVSPLSQARGRLDEDQLRATRWLRSAAIVYALAFLAHNGDHVRRGFGVLSTEVLWAGTLLAVVSVVAIGFALAGHRLAPVIAMSVGFPAALGVAASHLLPHWSALSDAFPGRQVDALSYAAVVSEIAGAVLLGAAGVYALRRSPPVRLATGTGR